MRLTSTNGRAPEVGLRRAVREGLAPDGGLYQPTALPDVTSADLAAWRGLPFASVARHLAQRLLDGEFSPEAIDRVVGDALDFPVPVRPLGDGISLLELFHGPTLAFKDFGARFLARLFSEILAEDGDQATVLVATSGDTGSAVARGFAGVPRTRVVVLYPAGKVSPFQEAQMATIGGNVTAVRVHGVFDDCQRLVKAALLDPDLAPLRLSSANSINIGRLLPQMFYYVTSHLAVAAAPSSPVVFVVPSGNLGNLTAGVMAARMGLPVVALRRRDERERRAARVPGLRLVQAAAVCADGLECDGRGRSEQLRPARDILRIVGRPHARGTSPACGSSEDETRAEIRERTGGPASCSTRTRRWRTRRHGASRAGAGADEPVIVLATAHPAKFARRDSRGTRIRAGIAGSRTRLAIAAPARRRPPRGDSGGALAAARRAQPRFLLIGARAAAATTPLRPTRPTRFGNTCRPFMRSPQAQTVSTLATAPIGMSRQ